VEFFRSLGVVFFGQADGEGIEGDLIFVGHDVDLAGEGISACVLGGAGFACFSPRTLTSGTARCISISGIRPGRYSCFGHCGDWLLIAFGKSFWFSLRTKQ
jgi:hypothetical protein